MSLDLDKYKTLLLARQQELERDNELARESRQAVELDQQSVGRVSRIDALQRQEMAKAGQERRKMELTRISAALQRISRDAYGDCLKCGEEIAERRLQFDPAVPLCIKCAG